MRNIISTQTTENCAGICGHFGVKVFISIFGVDNINLASPDDHFPKLDFVFSLKPWYDGRSVDALIDETEDHLSTLLIAEAP